MAYHISNSASDQSDGGFDLTDIFIGRQQQLDLFKRYLEHWKKLVLNGVPDKSSITTPPSPNNKIQGLVVLLFGRGGFGKSTLLKHYRDMVLQDGWNLATSKIVDWEFAVEGKRGLFNPPPGQLLDTAAYFKVLLGELAIALDRDPREFRAYQSALNDVERAKKEASNVLDNMQKDDHYGWLRGLTVEVITSALSAYVPGSKAVLDNKQVQGTLDAVAKLTQEQIAQVYARLHNKLGSKLRDYLEPSLQLGLALGSDLREMARNYPLLIFFDTYEEADEGDRLLRIVMGAAGRRVGWVITGRDNLWAGSGYTKRSPTLEYGYKEIMPIDRGLSIDFNSDEVGAFTLSDIAKYFTLLHKKKPHGLSLPRVTEEQANRILKVTQGVPLAVKIAAGLYMETANLDMVTEDGEGQRGIVDQMVRRYLLHTRINLEERARLYGLALLRRADQPSAVAAALNLSPEQARTSFSSELSRLHRRYSFIFTEKEQPALHQGVRHFLRLWLHEHRKEPEIKTINKRLKEAHESALQDLEEQMQYSTLKERLQDDEWVGIYLDLVEQQFWLYPVEGVRYALPFMIAAAIYRQEINEDAATIGYFFEQYIRQPYRDWWRWATQSLIYTTSRNPDPEALSGLEELVKLADQRCPTFPQPLPDYRKELEAALWWRLGESYQDRDENKALNWYEQTLTRLDKETELREDAAEAYSEIGIRLREEKKYTESIPLLGRAIELKPDVAWIYIVRGADYDELGEYQRALRDYGRAIELNPNDALAYNNRGYAYLMLKNALQARDDYHHSYELNSSDLNAAWISEWAGMNRQRPGMEMAAHLEAITAIDPQLYVAYVCRGVAAGLRGRVKEGLEEVEKAIPLGLEKWDAYFWKGMLLAYYRGLSSAEEAMNIIEQSLAVGLPPVLLTPLYWFEEDSPDLFVKYLKSLLLQYEI